MTRAQSGVRAARARAPSIAARAAKRRATNRIAISVLKKGLQLDTVEPRSAAGRASVEVGGPLVLFDRCATTAWAAIDELLVDFGMPKKGGLVAG
jgi:hypothetical protein